MTPSLQYLLQDPDTLELMRELTPEELKTVEVTERESQLGGTHYVRVNGENFFSFEFWCGRISQVKRLRAKPAPAPKPPAKKWEHMSIADASDKELSHLGQDGWELVAVVQPSPDSERRFYFKREKQ